MDRMVMQATQKSLMLLADSLACSSMQTPFARLVPATADGTCLPLPCCSGAFLQQLSSVAAYQVLAQTASVPMSMQQHCPQTPPLQQVPPYRSQSLHNPYLPPLRTLRSTNSSRMYSVKSATEVQQVEEPIIVAASWLGAKQGPFAK
jgi:hypothetical protein